MERIESWIAFNIWWERNFVAKAKLFASGDFMRGNTATYKAMEGYLILIISHSNIHDSYAVVVGGRILGPLFVSDGFNP